MHPIFRFLIIASCLLTMVLGSRPVSADIRVEPPPSESEQQRPNVPSVPNVPVDGSAGIRMIVIGVAITIGLALAGLWIARRTRARTSSVIGVLLVGLLTLPFASSSALANPIEARPAAEVVDDVPDPFPVQMAAAGTALAIALIFGGMVVARRRAKSNQE